MEFKIPLKRNKVILALGGESAGNFSVFDAGKIYFSEDFGDLLLEKNYLNFRKAIIFYLKKNKLKPDIILTDLHPLFNTTFWGEELAKKYKADRIEVQHHLAHIFSAVGDKIIHEPDYQLPETFYGIAMDGTGYGIDEKIWGGELFKLKTKNEKVETIERIGHLENQPLIGGELAIKEPTRMLIGILNKFLNQSEIYNLTKKYYSKNEFTVIFSQLEQNFNCLETSSTGRILDAVSLLLDFCQNERKYKHEPIDLLEKNSTKPYNLKPIIKDNVLLTTPLFEYLIKNLRKDKKCLAATSQFYIAEGLYEIIKQYCHSERSVAKPKNLPGNIASSVCGQIPRLRPSTDFAQNDIFISGGLANNKIISDYLISKGAYANKKIPRGDAGLSFGQVVYYLHI